MTPTERFEWGLRCGERDARLGQTQNPFLRFEMWDGWEIGYKRTMEQQRARRAAKTRPDRSTR